MVPQNRLQTLPQINYRAKPRKRRTLNNHLRDSDVGLAEYLPGIQEGRRRANQRPLTRNPISNKLPVHSSDYYFVVVVL